MQIYTEWHFWRESFSTGIAALAIAVLPACGDSTTEQITLENNTAPTIEPCLVGDVASRSISSFEYSFPEGYTDSFHNHITFLEELTGAENVGRINSIK